MNELYNQNQSSRNNPNPTLFPHIDYEKEITYKDLNLNFGSASIVLKHTRKFGTKYHNKSSLELVPLQALMQNYLVS
jgi:hypothetical protein